MMIPTEEAINRQVNEIMEILDSCPIEITSFNSSEYRKLFKKVIVYNRNKLVFIIENDDISNSQGRLTLNSKPLLNTK